MLFINKPQKVWAKEKNGRLWCREVLLLTVLPVFKKQCRENKVNGKKRRRKRKGEVGRKGKGREGRRKEGREGWGRKEGRKKKRKNNFP